jgi:hypothetical protein
MVREYPNVLNTAIAEAFGGRDGVIDWRSLQRGEHDEQRTGGA